MSKVEAIIKAIEEADEIEIMEFDFEPCFKLMREMEESLIELGEAMGDAGKDIEEAGQVFRQLSEKVDGLLEADS